MALLDTLKQGTKEAIPVNKPTGSLLDTLTPQFKLNSLVGRKRDTDTLEGLMDIARDKGVGAEAEKVVGGVRQGEKPKEIFSGGFISDVFDALSVGQYAIAGQVKGIGFKEGIKQRTSWTDPEMLGKYGLPGTAAGIAMDIFADPLNLIPVFGWGAKILKTVGQGTDFLKTTKVAGPVMDALGRAFVYGFGQDKVFLEMYENTIKAVAKGQELALDIAKPIAKLAKEDQVKIGQWMKGEIDDLPTDLMTLTNKARNEFKKVGQEAVDLKQLDADTYFANVNKYMPRLYLKHEMPPAFQKYMASIKPTRADLSRFLKREDIPEEIRKGMGEIMEAGLPIGKGLAQTRQAVEMTKFFNGVAKNFAKDVAEVGMKKLPMAKRIFTTSQGEIIQKYKQLKNLNIELKPFLNQLKSTFKADKEIIKKVESVERVLSETRTIQAEKFSAFFAGGGVVEKTVKVARRLGTLPTRLQQIGEQVKKFENLGELMKSETGLQVEKLFNEGVLQRAGFDSIDEFFKLIKSPFKAAITKEVIRPELGDIKKVISLQREVENLSESLSKFKEIDKRSINDAFRFLEDTINSIRTQKETIVGEIGALKLGTLAGKYIPEPMFRFIEEMVKPKSGLEKALGRAVGTWKFGKVVMNPATHARNILSNFLLNDFAGLSPARLDVYARAAKSLAKKDELYKEARAMGLGLDTFAANEIKELLLPSKGVGGLLKAGADKLSDIYQGEEQFAKMAMYIFQKGKGLSPQDAYKIAEQATFNYAQVTPFVRKLRSSVFGFPFITFTAKATPVVLKTAITHPGKISKIGKIARGVESLSPQGLLAKERESEPDYVRNGYFVRLPSKDKYGRSGYFDLTYIIPFGDLVSGQFFISPRPGENIIQSLLREQPLFNAVAELGANKDFFGKPIVQSTSIEPEQKGLDIMKYLAKFYGPPVLTDLPFRLKQSAEFEKASPEERQLKGVEGVRQTKTLAQEALRGLLGIKIQPIDSQSQATFADKEKRQALEEFLKAKGIVAEFKKTFIPKEKKESPWNKPLP